MKPLDQPKKEDTAKTEDTAAAPAAATPSGGDGARPRPERSGRAGAAALPAADPGRLACAASIDRLRAGDYNER